MWKTANDYVLKVTAYQPGKPIEEVARELGLPEDAIIKLASNENPLGPSAKALEAMHKALARANFYPDSGGYMLREAIAERLNFSKNNIILGNGSDEIIQFIAHAFLHPGDEIVISRYSFSVYKIMAQLFGANTVEAPDLAYTVDIDAILQAITSKTRVIFIANPNNPTGTMIGQATIARFMERVPDHILVVFDEAYYEFLDTPPDLLSYIRQSRNIVVMRTFSKIMGLANLRIGYGITTPELVTVLEKTKSPFNVNGIAQAGALAALSDHNHIIKTREITHQGREYFEQEFSAMSLEYIPSFGNFVLVRVGNGKNTFEAMLHKGIILRSMNSYGLPEWIRISVGTMPQNQRCIAELKELAKAGKLSTQA